MNTVIHTHSLAPGLTEVVLCRPERRNALSIDLLEGLSNTLDKLAAEKSERVIILRGEGPVFSAGLDLREAAQDALVERSAAGVERLLRTLRTSPLVSIAAVQGSAFAGGAGVMVACDIVVAADTVEIGFPEARRGLLPALIARVLGTKVRDGDLRDLFLVGEPISAQRAQQWGLIQRIVPPDQVLTEARRIAEAVLAGGPETIRITKQLINDLYHRESASGHALEELHLTARRSAEAREGLAAFAEKRNPKWMETKSS
ncbi:MAG: enoyl-CoA hydratase/isomerase family protein [Planctomycetaceae bacterium]